MRNILSITTVASLAIIAAAGSVSAQTTQPAGSGTAPHAGWMSIGSVTAKLEGQGYVVREIETDDGVYEVKALDKNGAPRGRSRSGHRRVGPWLEAGRLTGAADRIRGCFPEAPAKSFGHALA